MATPRNIEISHVWRLGVTGLQPTMTATLKRYENAAAEVAADETVTIAEVETTGTYYVTYTPTEVATYSLQVSESTTLREMWWEDAVSDAPDAATANYAYAAEADVVAVAQMGSYTTETFPTAAQVLGFLEQRAARIHARLVQVVGGAAPGPQGYALTIDETNDRGLALARIVRGLNAIGAARDALQSAGATQTVGQSQRVADLDVLWDEGLKNLDQAAMAYIIYSRVPATHLTRGDVQQVSTTTIPREQGLVFGSDTAF